MIKFTLVLLGFYFLYYLGNILYDLYFKKDKVLKTETTEEFSVGDFSQTDVSPTQVEIEDVENVNTPTSFLKNELQSQIQGGEDVKPKIEDLKKRFEAEQDIEDEEAHTIPVTESLNNEVLSTKIEEQETLKADWRSLLKLSETRVELVANYDGQKVYHSIS